ncbi:glycine oxidase ThiO [Corynebacterium falsenii]|uniref:glycine oxidase ThiO n=1 Tax=Corynebacterium falsenii TaxID=108486 RepID=UPI00234C55D0|nr:glycine oxidase ThiO [Corynebacterium falsenii]MDC7103579.1 glycine oxidase ThiO [Corynebacterium falsenii]
MTSASHSPNSVDNASADNASGRSFEHVIIGAGIIGLTTAFELVDAGVPPQAIAVVDPQPISGATFVAGGMLAPVAEVQYRQEPLYPLMVASGEMYPDLLRRLGGKTDAPTGHRRESTLVVGADRADGVHVRELLAVQHKHAMDAQALTIRQARRLEPGLSPQLAAAVEIPGDHQINPRMFTASVMGYLQQAGVRFIARPAEHVEGQTVSLSGGETITGSVIYLCNGLGAREVTGWYEGECPLALRPVYGDMLRLRVPDALVATSGEPLTRVVRAFVEDRPVYAIPRTDGTIAVGATSREDDRGGPAVDGVYTLLRDAIRVVPGLEECEFIEAIVGARPGTPDDLPYLGLVRDGLVVSTGYFRHGILLSALGAKVGAELGLGTTPGVDISACDPLRHAHRRQHPRQSGRK